MHIGLTSGHTLVIAADDEGTDVSKMFLREALARGAVPPGEQIDPDPAADTGFDRADVIRNALDDMLDGGAEDDFTADGRPNLRKLSARVGFQVARDEADKIWAEVSKAAESNQT